MPHLTLVHWVHALIDFVNHPKWTDNVVLYRQQIQHCGYSPFSTGLEFGAENIQLLVRAKADACTNADVLVRDGFVQLHHNPKPQPQCRSATYIDSVVFNFVVLLTRTTA